VSGPLNVLDPSPDEDRYLVGAMSAGICVGGCGYTWKLMPTPNVYAQSSVDPFAQVPPELQSNQVDVVGRPREYSAIVNDYCELWRSE